ncbi:MAG TPA: DNA gyrase modulator, partial [Gaiellaceae bacterium]|nr:DNA gyrase modulator [Gaiellaceae bacterium]
MSRALELADRALRLSQGDEADAVAHVERSGLARFAGSVVHQPTLVADESVTIRVVRDGRVGSASTNRTDDGGLHRAAGRAAEAADSSPRDPGWPGLPGPAAVPAVGGFDPETAVASSAGVAAAQAATDATVLVLAASREESGYADASSWRAGDLDPAAVAARAVATARRTRRAGTLE